MCELIRRLVVRIYIVVRGGNHRDIFKVCQYREEAGHIADDDFFYRVGQYTDVVGILSPLASYRLHSKSETGHLKNMQLVNGWLMIIYFK